MLGLLLPMIILAGLADWLFHLDAVIRVVLLAGLLVASAYLLYRGVLYPLLVRFRDLDIAMRIEERWPGLNDRLASTIQFLKLDVADDRYGSTAMREATVRQALAETDAIDFRQAIEPRPVLRALAGAVGVLAVSVALAMAAPISTRIALARLFLPFGRSEWPQRTHLELDLAHTTLKIARGDAFALGVRVQPGDRIPDSARAVYRFADGTEGSEPLRTLPDGEFRGRIERVVQPFRFSVVGGDDATSIRDVEVRVVPPPALESLAIRVVPPPDTGLSAQTLAPGLSQFRALEGTRLELDAVATKPLESAELKVGDKAEGVPVVFDTSRARFQARMPVTSSFTFWFRMKDTEGFSNRDEARYDVRSFKDEAPRVLIDEPKTDRDVPAEATVPVRILVDDDFGIHSARMIYKIATGESEPPRRSPSRCGRPVIRVPPRPWPRWRRTGS